MDLQIYTLPRVIIHNAQAGTLLRFKHTDSQVENVYQMFEQCMYLLF